MERLKAIETRENKVQEYEAIKKREAEEEKRRQEQEENRLAEERWLKIQEQDKLIQKTSQQRQQLIQQQDVPTEDELAGYQSPSHIPCAFGDEDLLGMSEEDLDMQCDDVFEDTPIPFKPRKGDILDQAIAD